LGAKIRVVFVLPTLIGGGAERVTLRIIAGLDPDRFESILVVGRLRGALCQSVPPKVRVLELNEERVSRSLPSLVRALKEIQPDVVYATLGMELPVGMARIFLKGKFQIISRLANTLSAFLEEIGTESLARSGAFLAANRMAYELCDVCVCQADFMLQDACAILEVDGEKFRRIYNPVSSRSNVEPLAKERPYVVSVGNLHHRKGYDLLIKAWALLKPPTHQLIIVGEGVERGRLEGQISAAGLEKDVILEGFQLDPQPWMKGAEFFVSSSRYEGLSNVILEALALGTPVVATDCPSGVREVLEPEKSGILVDPSVDGLVEGLTIGFFQHKLWREYEWQVIERFGEDVISQQWENLILELSA